MTDNTKYLVCDVCFNDQIIEDVNLLETTTLGKIVQGLWEDEKFYSTAMSFLKTKEDDNKTVKDSPLKSYHGLDSSVIRAYVAIRVLPNWKWLEFKDFVADFENRKESLTIGDVLGNLSNGATKPILKIIPKSEMEADDQEVKTIVQELLTTKSLATLSAAGCPLSKGMMSLIGQDKYACTISYDKREQFVYWLCRQDFKQVSVSPVKSVASPLMPIKIAKSRVTFHPEGEITKLEEWFDKNQRPNMEMIMGYTELLNKGRLGKSKRMLLPDSIAVWFKNRRAKAKKETSASHEQIPPKHIVASSHKLVNVVQQDHKMPTMVSVEPLSKRKKESGSLGEVGDQESKILHSEPSHATTETNIEQKIKGTTNVTQPAKGTSADSNTVLSCGEETVLYWILQDPNRFKAVPVDMDSQKTTDNQGADSLENGDKNIGNQQITKGNQSSENGDMETGDQSGIPVAENADKKNDDHNMVVTDSTGKLDSKTEGINNDEVGEDMHVVSNHEESKTENQLIQGEQDTAGVSSLKRAREEMDDENA